MGGRAPEDDLRPSPPPSLRPLLPAAAGLAAAVFVVLVLNGRPIGAGDTRPTEHAAASLVREGNLDLDEYPEVEPPFAREAGGHRVSIYPVLSAVLAAPVFAAAQLVFALDEAGIALAGKVAAALLSALAAGVLFLGMALRRPRNDALRAALLFALGTSVWSTSQALWQHPAAVLFLSTAVLLLVLAEHDPAWAGRVGLPLSLALAARHADVALAAAVAAGVAARWPRQLPRLLFWGSPAVAFVLLYQWIYFGSPLRHGFSGSLGRFSEPWGLGHLGLLVSPAKGLLVFTPLAGLAVAGLVSAWRRGGTGLAATLGGAALAHWLLVGRWGEWHGGWCWGPRMMTDALPLLFVFLPEGWDLAPRLGAALAAVSVAVQGLGAFSYDYRWERIFQNPPAAGRPELWSVSDSPIPFYAGQRVAILALPVVRDGRVVVHEHPLVLFGATGSRIRFAGDRLRVSGAEATCGDVHAVFGARIASERLLLARRWDGLFLRVLPPARSRRLEVRIAGRGHGWLYVGERGFWSDAPRWKAYPMDGDVSIRQPYYFPESGGADLLVTIGKSPGEAALESVALVPPGEPENVIEAP